MIINYEIVEASKHQNFVSEDFSKCHHFKELCVCVN